MKEETIMSMTRRYLKERNIKRWYLVNNGILDYGTWLREELKKQYKIK